MCAGLRDQADEYGVKLLFTSETNVLPLAEATSTSKSTRSTRALDANGDDSVSPQDALLIVNFLNQLGGPDLINDLLQLVCDVNKDDHVTPIDALTLINYLNRDGSAAAGVPAATTTSSLPADAVQAANYVISTDQVFAEMGRDNGTETDYVGCPS